MNEFQQFLLLCKVQLRIWRHRFLSHMRTSRLMSTTIVLFLLLYSVVAYLIFSHGLRYLATLPAAGEMLVDRVIYLIFFCFFLLLAFSSGIASYIALFRSRETSWMLTLPISHRVVCLWKCLESALFSSWGLIFIMAPLLVAFAQHREAGLSFYLKTIASLVPFVVIATGISVLFVILIVRWLKRIHVIGLMIVAAVFLAISLFQVFTTEKELAEQAGVSSALTFQLVLRHTDISTNPLWPSAWLAKSTIDWSRPWRNNVDPLNTALLISNGLMILLLCSWLAYWFFFSAKNLSLQHAAANDARRRARAKRPLFPSLTDNSPVPLPRSPLLAVSIKDIRTFIREPGQWLQFLIIFGLLALYALSLRHMEYNRSSPQEARMFAFLNLTVCALALSTLTTRFVFPQFSLEGRRFWVLVMSPLYLPHIILQKLILSTLFTGSTTFAILLISGHMLELPANDIAFFATAIVVLSIGLNSIAVSFGALFPNMRETNSAKIVSGFGGTLCLITSFAYVALFIFSLLVARISLARANADLDLRSILSNQTCLIALGIALFTSVLATVLPVTFSIKTIKKLVFLEKL